MSTSTILIYPNLEETFNLTTNVIGPIEKDLPIAYTSRTLASCDIFSYQNTSSKL